MVAASGTKNGAAVSRRRERESVYVNEVEHARTCNRHLLLCAKSTVLTSLEPIEVFGRTGEVELPAEGLLTPVEWGGKEGERCPMEFYVVDTSALGAIVSKRCSVQVESGVETR